MIKRKRSTKRNERIDDLTRSSKKNKRTCCTRSSTKSKTICNGGGTTELLISGDLHVESNRGSWSEPIEEFAYKLSTSVVSLALSNGHTVLFTCSGVAILCEGYASRILTSASLVKEYCKRKDHGNLKVEVHHGDRTAEGFLGECDLDYNIVTVNVMNLPNIQTVLFRFKKAFSPHCNVLAVGRHISGKLITTSGILSYNLRGPLPSLMTTTCKISKISEGGPLVDFDGNFLGMNLTCSTEGTSFVPEARILGQFWNFFTSLEDIEFPMSVRCFMLMRWFDPFYLLVGSTYVDVISTVLEKVLRCLTLIKKAFIMFFDT